MEPHRSSTAGIDESCDKSSRTWSHTWVSKYVLLVDAQTDSSELPLLQTLSMNSCLTWTGGIPVFPGESGLQLKFSMATLFFLTRQIFIAENIRKYGMFPQCQNVSDLSVKWTWPLAQIKNTTSCSSQKRTCAYLMPKVAALGPMGGGNVMKLGIAVEAERLSCPPSEMLCNLFKISQRPKNVRNRGERGHDGRPG